jgi:ketosteroid isomerase-like protein
MVSKTLAEGRSLTPFPRRGKHPDVLKPLVIAIALSALTSIPAMQDMISPALLKLADTERAFARRARETTVRQAFIDFFADESIAFEPDPVPAREALRKRTTPQPAGFELHWEPRLGDIAASGDLGYLTGPAEYINPGKPNTYTCYFSVWKRQPDGEFRVILDVGISTKEKAPFAPGFVRSAAVASWKGTEPRERAEASLLAADKTLAAAIAGKGASVAFRSVMHPSSRLNRNGLLPMTRDAAVDWLAREVTEMSSEPLKVETAASGDLGYTWGKYTAKGPTSSIGSYYIRVWTRKADGSWQLVSDITTPPPPPAR